jgi:hypothetical protein
LNSSNAQVIGFSGYYSACQPRGLALMGQLAWPAALEKEQRGKESNALPSVPHSPQIYIGIPAWVCFCFFAAVDM